MSNLYRPYEYYADRGVKAQHYDNARAAEMPVLIADYADAKNWYDGRAGEWPNTAGRRPVGKNTDRTRVMYMEADGSIGFRYDNHTLATWHPDNTVTVEPFATNKWGMFERNVLPLNIEVDYGSRVGKIIKLKRMDSLTDKVGLADGSYVSNPQTWVIKGEGGVQLRPGDEVDRWEPVDPEFLNPFEWFEIDKSMVSYVSKKYNVSEFVAAIETAMQMGAEIKTAGSNSNRYYSKIDSSMTDPETGEPLTILQLLEQRRYIDAASLVRINQSHRWDDQLKRTVYETKGLKASDLKAIRRLAYKELGCIYLESQEVVTLAQLGNIETKLREFGMPVTDRVL